VAHRPIVHDVDDITAVLGDHIFETQWVAWITLGVRNSGIEPSAIGKGDLHARRPCCWVLLAEAPFAATHAWFNSRRVTKVACRLGLAYAAVRRSRDATEFQRKYRMRRTAFGVMRSASSTRESLT
jgi:hypothetical protein